MELDEVVLTIQFDATCCWVDCEVFATGRAGLRAAKKPVGGPGRARLRKPMGGPGLPRKSPRTSAGAHGLSATHKFGGSLAAASCDDCVTWRTSVQIMLT